MASKLTQFGKTVAESLQLGFEEESEIVLVFTEDSVNEICSSIGISKKDLMIECRNFFVDAANAVDYRGNFYNSLGVCAIQVMIAYQCVANDQKSYNDKFSRYLDISETELQGVYSNSSFSSGFEPRQEKLWKFVSDELSERYQLKLLIPEPTIYSGRYVQFPRSQQLFSLRRYHQWEKHFKTRCKISHGSTYSFSEFSERVFGNAQACTGNPYFPYLDLRMLERLARRAIFYCFCNWSISDQKAELSRKPTISSSTHSDSFFLSTDNEKQTYKVRNGRGKEQVPENITSKELLFVFDENYEDWTEVEKLSFDKTCGVLADLGKIKSLCPRIFDISRQYSNGNCKSSRIRFFAIFPESSWNCIPERWKKHSSGKGIELIGGLKSPNKLWIAGFLPAIKFQRKLDYFFVDSKKMTISNELFDLNSCNLGVGSHSLKVPEYSPLVIGVDSLKPRTISFGWTWKAVFSCFLSSPENWMLSSLEWKKTEKSEHPDNIATCRMGKAGVRYQKMRDRFVRISKEY